MPHATYIQRAISEAIDRAAQYYRVICITGPRQTGKTTLCRRHFADYSYYSLENKTTSDYVRRDYDRFLSECGQRVVLDEVQYLPELLHEVQHVVDNDPDRRFVLTGSCNFALVESITQSLAGRVAMFTLLPFALGELGDYGRATPTDQMLLNGLYPGVVADGVPTELFYSNYYTTYIERDVRNLRNFGNLASFQTFLRLLAGRVGSEVNASRLCGEVGVSAPTIKSWLSVLAASYIVFTLQPYYVNISKRLTKTPKVYFYDTGLLCHLLGIENATQLATHPLRGALFENFAVVELMKQRVNQGKLSNLYFFRESAGHEIDVVQTEADRLHLYEVKSSMTYHSDFMRNIDYMRRLLDDKVAAATVVYDGATLGSDTVNVRDIFNSTNPIPDITNGQQPT